jgi:beta-phosphoglucomutase
MKIKGLLFDLDGVIVSTEKNHFEAWRETALSLGIDFTECLKGISRAESLIKILELGRKSVSAEKFQELLKSKNDLYLQSIQNLSQDDLLPGVLNVLQHAKEFGILLGVGSSSKNAIPILDKLGIHRFFQVVIDGNGVTNPKPNPEVFLKGSDSLRLSPDQCMVFEDAVSGIEAAKSGGFVAVGVGNPNIRKLSDLYFESLNEFNLNDYVELV